MPAKFEASALFEFLGRVDRELAARSIIFGIRARSASARGYPPLQPFEVETLVARYQATEVVGPRRRFALALLDLVARFLATTKQTSIALSSPSLPGSPERAGAV